MSIVIFEHALSGSQLLAGALVSALVGLALGSLKRRSFLGAGLGFLLGPIGWIIVLLVEPSGEKCHACKGVLEPGATACRHCGRDVVAKGSGFRPYQPMPDPAGDVKPLPPLRQRTRKLSQ